MSEITKKNILLIEDETELLEMLSEFFQDRFDNVFKAEDGAKGLELAKANKVDIILSDIKMPNMTGVQMIQHLRAAGILCPVIFFTGTADRDLVLSVLRLGASDVIDKPAQIETVIATVEKVLEIKEREKKLYSSQKESNEEQLQRQQKMIGLLHNSLDGKKNAS